MKRLEEGRIVAKCVECDNTAEVWDDDPKPLCEWCFHASECEKPKTMRFYSAHFGGHAVAQCELCNYTNVYWECGCDFEHDCEEHNG